MSVLEICQLKVKDGISPTDPRLLQALSKARSELRERVINTKSQFYQCIEEPSLIYILGIWPSLARHHEFLSTPEKAEILDSQQSLFDFGYILHIPLSEMSLVPFDAPVMGIARLHVKSGEHVTRYQDAVDQYRNLILEGTKPYPMVAEWRIDSEEGKQEHVILTGWETKDKHAEFTKKTREEFPDYAAVRDNYKGMEVKHARNMEKAA